MSVQPIPIYASIDMSLCTSPRLNQYTSTKLDQYTSTKRDLKSCSPLYLLKLSNAYIFICQTTFLIHYNALTITFKLTHITHPWKGYTCIDMWQLISCVTPHMHRKMKLLCARCIEHNFAPTLPPLSSWGVLDLLHVRVSYYHIFNPMLLISLSLMGVIVYIHYILFGVMNYFFPSNNTKVTKNSFQILGLYDPLTQISQSDSNVHMNLVGV